MNGSGPACATASIGFDGGVNLTIGSVDIGGTRPVAAQQFAEVLGISVEDVNPQVGDTETIGFTSMTGGSGRLSRPAGPRSRRRKTSRGR